MGVFDLIGVAAKGAKKAAPFFSKADVVLDELPRNKGLGNEFLAELVKKGAKPTELKERGIEKALKDKPKMTKAEVKKVFEEKAPPKVQEKVLTSDAPDYEEFLEAKAQEIYGVDWFDLNKDEKKKLDKMFSDLPLTQYDKYKTPGGENYREILLKLPAFNDKRLMELEADIRRSESVYRDPMSMPDFRAKLKEVEELKAEKAAAGTPYVSGHYKQDPNLLAHIRVQDFISPTYTKQQAEEIGQRIAAGMGLADPKNLGSGSINVAINKGYVTPLEAAQYADFRKFQGVDTTGAKRKVLLVDEVQSDWHQEGRKKGYRGDQQKTDWDDPEYVQARMRAMELGNEYNSNNANPARQAEIEPMLREARDAERAFSDRNNKIGSLVPDAPFKKNWHELAMKRVLDYAAENGYDTVAITPGAEQAKRYDLSKQVDELLYKRNDDGTYQLSAQTGGYGRMLGESVAPDKLEDYVGKEIAQKIVGGEGAKTEVAGKYDPASMTSSKEYMQSLSGIDLQVGGEGMKGFYDKILPDYLNNYGKQYGASVRQEPLTYSPSAQRIAQGEADDALLGQLGVETPVAPQVNYHKFDITPQMREAIQTKGQPLYSKIGVPGAEAAAGAGAATIGSQMFDENNEQTVQNPVHFTENPDAMLLELMQRN